MAYVWHGSSLVVQLVKNPPAMRETWVQSLGWEETLEKEKLLTPVFWPGEFHGLYSPWGRQESNMTKQLSLYVWHALIDIVTDALKKEKKQIWKVQIKTQNNEAK